MFLDNKYTKTYYKIIEKAKNREYDGFTETHHIIPKSIGGENTLDNLVKLKPREHFICHCLLIKMVESPEYKRKMTFAIHRMKQLNRDGETRLKTSVLYDLVKTSNSHRVSGENNPCRSTGLFGELNPMSRPDVKKKHLESMNKPEYKEKMSKLCLGENNPFYGKKHSQDTKKKLRHVQSKPIRVTFNDGNVVEFECKRDLGPYLGKSIALGAKLNRKESRHIWPNYNIMNIEEINEN